MSTLTAGHLTNVYRTESRFFAACDEPGCLWIGPVVPTAAGAAQDCTAHTVRTRTHGRNTQ